MRPLRRVQPTRRASSLEEEIRTQTQKKTCEDTGRKREPSRSQRGASAEINLDNTLDFQTPEL